MAELTSGMHLVHEAVQWHFVTVVADRERGQVSPCSGRAQADGRLGKLANHDTAFLEVRVASAKTPQLHRSWRPR